MSLVVRRVVDPPGAWGHARAVPAGRDRVLVRGIEGTWLLDLHAGEWRRCDPPEPMQPGVSLPDGTVWCRGETGGWNFDPEATRWEPSPPPPDVKHAICGRVGDDVFMSGGRGPAACHSWRGDPRTGRWEAGAPMPLGRLTPGTVAVTRFPQSSEHGPAGERVLVVGHNNLPVREQSERIDVYDPLADRWTSLPCASAASLSRSAPGWLGWLRTPRVKSVWGVVLDAVVVGDTLVAPLGQRRNEERRWSVRPLRRLAMFDLRTLAWRSDVVLPRDVPTSFGAGASMAGGAIFPGRRGIDVWDGERWHAHSWPDGAVDTVVALARVDDARSVVIGRQSTFVVEGSGPP